MLSYFKITLLGRMSDVHSSERINCVHNIKRQKISLVNFQMIMKKEKENGFSPPAGKESICDAIGKLYKHYTSKNYIQKEPVQAIKDSLLFVATLCNLVKHIT